MNRRRVPRNRKVRRDEANGRYGESGRSGPSGLSRRSGSSLDQVDRPLSRLRRLCPLSPLAASPIRPFAAIFEVGGDAIVRLGIKSNNILLMLLGALPWAATA